MAEADQHHQTECGHRVKGRFDTSEGNRADSKSRVVPPDGWVERQRDADSAHGRGDLQRGGQEQPPAVVSDPGEAVGWRGMTLGECSRGKRSDDSGEKEDSCQPFVRSTHSVTPHRAYGVHTR